MVFPRSTGASLSPALAHTPPPPTPPSPSFGFRISSIPSLLAQHQTGCATTTASHLETHHDRHHHRHRYHHSRRSRRRSLYPVVGPNTRRGSSRTERRRAGRVDSLVGGVIVISFHFPRKKGPRTKYKGTTAVPLVLHHGTDIPARYRVPNRPPKERSYRFLFFAALRFSVFLPFSHSLLRALPKASFLPFRSIAGFSTVVLATPIGLTSDTFRAVNVGPRAFRGCAAERGGRSRRQEETARRGREGESARTRGARLGEAGDSKDERPAIVIVAPSPGLPILIPLGNSDATKTTPAIRSDRIVLLSSGAGRVLSSSRFDRSICGSTELTATVATDVACSLGSEFFLGRRSPPTTTAGVVAQSRRRRKAVED